MGAGTGPAEEVWRVTTISPWLSVGDTDVAIAPNQAAFGVADPCGHHWEIGRRLERA